MARVKGLYRLGLRVPDLATMDDFYEHQWRLERIGSDNDQIFFQSNAVAHADFALRKAAEAGLDYIAFEVASEDELHAILEQAGRAGTPIAERLKRGTRPGDALVAAIIDLDGNRIELVVPKPSEISRGSGGSGEGPKRLGHVVLWTPRVEHSEAFYRALGFQVSDRTHVGMSFLRCNTDHHTVAFVRSNAGRAGLQHVAFDIGSLDAVMKGFARLRSAGTACIWGVGRHGPGNNIFSYYEDPLRNIVEYYSDMEKVALTDDDLQARFWGAEHKGDIWGVAGPPPSPFRG
jgi:catechol 2,3-dioxygenase-like lactoylglutathione lyase family enzyme